MRTFTRRSELRAKCRWLARHPAACLHLLRGLTVRDLILRKDLRRLGYRIPVREARGLGLSNLNVEIVGKLAETFGDRPPRTLLDAGAAHGGFSVAAGLAFPGLRIRAFEPLRDAFDALERSLARFPGARAYPLALGSAEGTSVIHRSRNPGSSSLLPMLMAHEAAFPGTAAAGEETIRVRSLDDVLAEEEAALEPPVLLKIDVQGYEDRVIEGAARTIGKVDGLLVEMSLVPLYEGQRLRDELEELIEGLGFTFSGTFGEIVSPATGKVVQIDGLFRR